MIDKIKKWAESPEGKELLKTTAYVGGGSLTGVVLNRLFGKDGLKYDVVAGVAGGLGGLGVKYLNSKDVAKQIKQKEIDKDKKELEKNIEKHFPSSDTTSDNVDKDRKPITRDKHGYLHTDGKTFYPELGVSGHYEEVNNDKGIVDKLVSGIKLLLNPADELTPDQEKIIRFKESMHKNNSAYLPKQANTPSQTDRYNQSVRNLNDERNKSIAYGLTGVGLSTAAGFGANKLIPKTVTNRNPRQQVFNYFGVPVTGDNGGPQALQKAMNEYINTLSGADAKEFQQLYYKNNKNINPFINASIENRIRKAKKPVNEAMIAQEGAADSVAKARKVFNNGPLPTEQHTKALTTLDKADQAYMTATRAKRTALDTFNAKSGKNLVDTANMVKKTQKYVYDVLDSPTAAINKKVTPGYFRGRFGKLLSIILALGGSAFSVGAAASRDDLHDAKARHEHEREQLNAFLKKD